jgi:hypothetical protein
MKRLHVQLQPARSPGLDEAVAAALLCGLSPGARVTNGKDTGRYINIDYPPADAAGLWAAIRRELMAVSGLADATIVVCEGDRGWDDYLLLHHYDPAETLDEMV